MSESDSSSSSNSSESSPEESDDGKKEKEGTRKIIDIKSILGKIDQPIREPTLPTKSSDEILSELFGVFNAQPPQIKEPEQTVSEIEVKDKDRKSKKSKKKHKHKHKKHKKRKYEEGDISSNKSKHKKHKKKHKSHKSSKDKVENAEDVKSKDLTEVVKKVPDVLKVSKSIHEEIDIVDKSEVRHVESNNVNRDSKDIEKEIRKPKQGEDGVAEKTGTSLLNDNNCDKKLEDKFVKDLKNETRKSKEESVVKENNKTDIKVKWLSIPNVKDERKEQDKTKVKYDKESTKTTEKPVNSSLLITKKVESSDTMIQVAKSTDENNILTKSEENVCNAKLTFKLEEKQIMSLKGNKSKNCLEVVENIVKSKDSKNKDTVEDEETKKTVDKCKKEHQKSNKHEKEYISNDDKLSEHKTKHEDKRNKVKNTKNKDISVQDKTNESVDVNVEMKADSPKLVTEGKVSHKEMPEDNEERKRSLKKDREENKERATKRKNNEVKNSEKDVSESKVDKTYNTERERKASEAQTIRAEIEELKLQIIKKETKKLNQNMKDKNSVNIKTVKAVEENDKENSVETIDVKSASEKELLKKDTSELNKENKVLNASETSDTTNCTVGLLEDVPLPPQPAGTNDKKSGSKKITIKNLKFSSVFEETIRQVEEEARLKAEKLEEGEITDSSPESSHQLSADEEVDPVLGNVVQFGESELQDDENKSLENISITIKQDRKRHRSKSSNGEKTGKHKEKRKKKRSGNHSHHKKHKSRSKSRHKSRSESRHKSRSKSRHKSRSRSKSRSSSRNRGHKRNRSSSEKREHKSRRKSIGSSRSDESPERFDKKKLLEIARKNVVSMCKQGSLPSSIVSQDKVLAIKAGGKSVAELTDFCKQLSKKEAEEGPCGSDRDSSDGDMEKAFHHPFQIKERPSSIVVNIRNSVQLPLKTLKEKAAEQSKQLRIQFPVSSGQQHRKTESEWIPVSPKKEAPPQPAVSAKVQAARLAAKQKNIFSSTRPNQELDIGSIVSQRLSAIRKLQENPNDVQAINQMYSAQRAMQTWAESKQEPGQFTGSTGARVLSPAELSAGYQAWAKKDQFREAVPVSGGMGMTLLQKMGWRPGEGLGKNKEGSLEPLTLEIKMDKKGLMAQEDLNPIPLPPMPAVVPPPVPPAPTVVPVPRGKHPVSVLVETCTKRRWGAPQFELCFECGPDHKKHFLFKVRVNGIEYKPSVASPNKKQAKAEAAAVCLGVLGIPCS